MFENPWKQDKIDKQGEEYIKKYKGESDKDFSWILDGDKKAIESVYDDNNNKDKQSIDWGLPNQVVGDPDTATFFLCLLNPRVQDADSPYGDFKGYVDKESLDKESVDDKVIRNPDEYSEDKEFYYQHIIHSKENELSKEIREMKEKIERKDVFQFEKQLDDFDKKVKDLKLNGSDEELKNYKKHHDPLKSQYYLYSYYNFIMRGSKIKVQKNNKSKKIEENGRDVQINLFKDNDSVDKLNQLKICNLELFPYRTESKPKGELDYCKLESSRYVASLVVNRILKSESNSEDNPVFFFRSYEEWSKVILEVLGEKKELEGKKLMEKYNSMADHFYVGASSQSMAITRNNIRKAPKIIRDEDYENIEDVFSSLRGK